MSAQPEEVPVPPVPAAAQLLTQLRADRRADSWVPAFERDWAKALEDSRHSYSLPRCTTLCTPGPSHRPRCHRGRDPLPAERQNRSRGGAALSLSSPPNSTASEPVNSVNAATPCLVQPAR
ncbi:hypothetical protein NKH18_01840 [Streptomyces sp. M10(2022)]